MAINKPFDRHLILGSSGVKKTGGSLALVKGQLALIDTSKSTVDGAKIISTTAGYPKNKKNLELRLGTTGRDADRSQSNKSEMTVPFSLAEVKSIDVSAPKRTTQSLDEIVVGYDGFDDASSFDFKVGDAYFNFTLELTGDKLAYRGGGQMDKEVVSVTVDIPNVDPFACDPNLVDCAEIDCKAVTLEVVNQLRNRQLTGGHLLTEYVDITPVFKCDNPTTPTTVEYRFYEITVCDTGADNALAEIQYQYDSPVIRTNRVGAKSTYQIFLPSLDGAPTDYSQTVTSLIKGCDDCPAGYTEVEGGIVYAFTVEDDGEDLSSVFEAFTPVVAGTVVKSGNDNGVGFYTAVATRELTDAEIDSILSAAAPNPTITFDVVGTVAAICTDDTVTNTAWVAGETCASISERYTIVLPDTECGDVRTAEINAAYPQTVTAAYTAAVSEITLTGTSGTIEITFDTDTYEVNFDTDLTTSAANFVASDAASILAAWGITVTSVGAVITLSYTGNAMEIPTVTTTASDLAGALSTTFTTDSGACQTRYEMEVVSNIVCDECDPVFKDYYTTELPESYDQTEWVKDVVDNLAGTVNCKCGIRITAKDFLLNSDESLRDQIAFTESSIKLRASAGFPEEIREGIGRLPKGQYEAKYLSRWEPRTHLGGNLRCFEDKSRTYFRDTPHYNDYLSRILTGQLSNIEDNLAQYVDYSLTVSHFKNTQGLAGRINEDITYHVYVEVGKHKDVEDLLNDIAANAGVGAVQAFGA